MFALLPRRFRRRWDGASPSVARATAGPPTAQPRAAGRRPIRIPRWRHKPKRRRFTADYKQRILAEVDQAKGSGGIGALLRREGLYSSLLTTWRRERKAGVLEALAPRKRGPKSKRDPVAEENQQLRRQNQRLTEDLRKAEIVMDVQKKVAALLGRPILTADPRDQS